MDGPSTNTPKSACWSTASRWSWARTAPTIRRTESVPWPFIRPAKTASRQNHRIATAERFVMNSCEKVWSAKLCRRRVLAEPKIPKQTVIMQKKKIFLKLENVAINTSKMWVIPKRAMTMERSRWNNKNTHLWINVSKKLNKFELICFSYKLYYLKGRHKFKAASKDLLKKNY